MARLTIAALALAGLPAAAAAEVATQTDTAFVVVHKLTVAAPPARIWAMIGQPARWWSSAHSWSGNAANMSMALRPGGCFCETLPGRGGVEHMRVIHADRNGLVRLSGALGPLQAGAATGTLSITFKAAASGGGSELELRYVVSGHTGFPVAAIAPAVDGVIGQQARGLKAAAEQR